MKHPHAELFIAIADGESIDDFEAKREVAQSFIPAVNWIATLVLRPEQVTVRRKAKTIKVNGFQVPEPKLDEIRYIAIENPARKDQSANLTTTLYSYSNLRLTFDGETGKLKKAEVI